MKLNSFPSRTAPSTVVALAVSHPQPASSFTLAISKIDQERPSAAAPFDLHAFARLRPRRRPSAPFLRLYQRRNAPASPGFRSAMWVPRASRAFAAQLPARVNPFLAFASSIHRNSTSNRHRPPALAAKVAFGRPQHGRQRQKSPTPSNICAIPDGMVVRHPQDIRGFDPKAPGHPRQRQPGRNRCPHLSPALRSTINRFRFRRRKTIPSSSPHASSPGKTKKANFPHARSHVSARRRLGLLRQLRRHHSTSPATPAQGKNRNSILQTCEAEIFHSGFTVNTVHLFRPRPAPRLSTRAASSGKKFCSLKTVHTLEFTEDGAYPP